CGPRRTSAVSGRARSSSPIATASISGSTTSSAWTRPAGACSTASSERPGSRGSGPEPAAWQTPLFPIGLPFEVAALRLLHTADWHLGRVFHGRSLLEDQAAVLDALVRMVGDERPDAVLVAGDIYDRSVPPADAVRLLDDTLTRIVVGVRTPVFLIAGNHDGPDRLSFGARLMAGAGLRVEAVPVVAPGASVLADAHGEVEIFALPYAEPPMMRNVLGADAQVPDHAAVLAAQMAAVRRARDPSRRLVVMAHAF